MRMTFRRIMVDSAVGLAMGLEGITLIGAAYELGQKVGSGVAEYGLPALATIASVPLAYIATKATDIYMTDRNNFLNKLLDRFTYL